MNVEPDPVFEALERRHTLILPSTQRCTAVSLIVARKRLQLGDRVWQTPKVLTPVGFANQLLAAARVAGQDIPRSLTGAQEWRLWVEVTQGLIAESASALLAPQTLARSLQRAALHVAAQGIPPAELAGFFSDETRWLVRAMSAVEQHAQASGALPSHRVFSALASVPPPVQPVLFAGFEPQLAPAWRRLVVAWQKAGAPVSVDDSVAASSGARSAKLVAAADPECELRAAAHWCQQQLQQHAAARLLIVVPDLAVRRSLVQRVLLEFLDPAALARGDRESDLVTCEGGTSLAQYPQIALAISCLGWLTQSAPLHEVLNLLLIEAGVSDPDGYARLEVRLRARLPDPCTPRNLLDALLSFDGAKLRAVGRLSACTSAAINALQSEPHSTLFDWASRMTAALDAFDFWNMSPRDSAAQQTRARWQELLEDFAEADAAGSHYDAQAACALLQSLAQQASFAPASDDVAITVTDYLDDPIAHYDGIWVTGCSASSLPAVPRPDPFIPWQLQRRYQLPGIHADACLAEARQRLAAWAARSDALRLSFAQRVDAAPASPSPLLHDLPMELVAEQVSPVESPETNLEAFVDPRGAQWDTRRPLPRGSRAIELSLQCPFRAFAELRLGATALEPPRAGIDPRERGRLLHAALDLLWQGGSERQRLLLHGTEIDVQREIAAAVDKASSGQRASVRATDPAMQRLWQRERRRAQRLLWKALSTERERAPFQVTHREQATSAILAGATVNLRVDRIDQLATGEWLIIDYKTGKRHAINWFEPRTNAAQLLVYLTAVGQWPEAKVRGLANFHLTTEGATFASASTRADAFPGRVQFVDDWAGQASRWHQLVADAAAQFVSGDARVDPVQGACEHCDLPLLCRRSQFVGVVDADAEDALGRDDE